MKSVVQELGAYNTEHTISHNLSSAKLKCRQVETAK